MNVQNCVTSTQHQVTQSLLSQSLEKQGEMIGLLREGNELLRRLTATMQSETGIEVANETDKENTGTVAS